MRRDSLDELTCAGELHRRNLSPAKTIIKLWTRRSPPASPIRRIGSPGTRQHSFASILATDLELPATTLARLTGHSDAGFTLKVYAKDGRDEAAVVSDLLERASTAGIGG